MKYLLSDTTLEFANKVAKHKWIKRLLKPFYYSYKGVLQRMRNRNFRKYALEALTLFDKAMTNGGYNYTLAFGTLLGAVREKGFIKHDLDIDVFMWSEEWSREIQGCLSNVGFNLEHVFVVDKGSKGREETYEYKGVTIDIFYLYPPLDHYPYCCDFIAFPMSSSFRNSMDKYGGLIVRRIELPIKKGRLRVLFEGIPLYIPSDYEEVLSFRYGPDYMIPNPEWSIDSYDNHIKVWDEYMGEFFEGTLPPCDGSNC